MLHSHAILGTLALVSLLAASNAPPASSTSKSDVAGIVSQCGQSGSTLHIAKCIYKEVQLATADMNASFLKLKANDEKYWGPYSRFDPHPEMDSAQAAWRQWMKLECHIQANLPRGSVGAIRGPECELRLTRARQADLDRLAQNAEKGF